MSGAQVGDLGLLDIGDGRRIPVKVTRLNRKGFVSEAQRPLPGKSKAVFRGPCLTLLIVEAQSLPLGVDAVLNVLPASFLDLAEARVAIEPHHVPRCQECGIPMPDEPHDLRLCDACNWAGRERFRAALGGRP